MVNIFLSLIPNSRFQIRNSRLISSWLSILRFLIPDSRFYMPKAISLLILTLLLTITVPLHAATPGFDTLVNYDTAWTFVYDGGKLTTGSAINDIFYDVKCLANGTTVCVGTSGDSLNSAQSVFLKLDINGKILQKKLFTTNNTVHSYYNGQSTHSLYVAKNGDFILGGYRFNAPWVMRLDSLEKIKWTAWYYDSTKGVSGKFLQGSGIINCLRETSRGTIICATGDEFPNNNGMTMHNYAAMIEFDSLGRSPYDSTQPCYVNNEFNLDVGYNIDGFYIDETKGKNFVLSGYQSVYYTDSLGNPLWKSNYTFSLAGVGTVKNNISRAKVLRDNTLIVAGQAYEGNCWTKYKTLYYDAWWSPVNYGSGLNTNWDTAGLEGRTDYLFDFTQLNNGDLVFVGTKGGANGSSPLWVFVTDSVGKKQFFEKQFLIPTPPNINADIFPMSVAASPDGGFTVVGKGTFDTTSGYDAFAMHFIPKPVSAVVSRNNSSLKSNNGFSVRIAGGKLIVLNTELKALTSVSLFDISGKRVAAQSGNKVLSFDISKFARGTYLVRVKSGTTIETIKFVY